MERNYKKDLINNEQTEIIFYNGYRLEPDVSKHTLMQQMDRAFVVMYESGMIDEKQQGIARFLHDLD